MDEGITNPKVRELVAAIEEHSASGQCANCGDNDWIALSSPVTLQGDSEEFPCLAVACKGCGFLRLHAEDALKTHDW